MFHKLSAVFAAIVLATVAPACQNPCSALSDQICECKPNQPEEAACLERVNLSEAEKSDESDITEAEEAACEQHLETCTCEALEDGELAKCGLAK